MNVNEILTNQVAEQMANGIIPWQRPWSGGVAVNYVSRKPYRGINTFLLPPGEWASFKQITALGGNVKGQKSKIAVFYKPVGIDPKDPTKMKGMILRYYNVFNAVACGLETKLVLKEHDSIVEADNLIDAYINSGHGPMVTVSPSCSACYVPSLDVINMPTAGQFDEIGRYYSTYFHEITHSTGHKSRLDRDLSSMSRADYSKEELVAELAASIICAQLGIDNNLEQSAAYLAGWLSAISADTTLMVSASSKAQKAVDFIVKSVEVEEEIAA